MFVLVFVFHLNVDLYVVFSQIAYQDYEQAKNEVKLAEVNAATSRLEAEQHALIIVQQAQVTAAVALASADYQSNATLARISSEKDSFALLKQNLGFTSNSQLLSFYKMSRSNSKT